MISDEELKELAKYITEFADWLAGKHPLFTEEASVVLTVGQEDINKFSRIAMLFRGMVESPELDELGLEEDEIRSVALNLRKKAKDLEPWCVIEGEGIYGEVHDEGLLREVHMLERAAFLLEAAYGLEQPMSDEEYTTLITTAVDRATTEDTSGHMEEFPDGNQRWVPDARASEPAG